MIEQLTLEQTARFPEFIEKWTKIGLSTELADRPRAEAAIRLIYEAGGLTPPEQIIWFDSPYQMFVNYSTTNKGSSVFNMVKNATIESVTTAVKQKIDLSVYVCARNGIDNYVWKSVWSPTVCYVWCEITDTVKTHISDIDLRETVSGIFWQTVYGSHESHQLASLNYYRTVLGLIEETNKLNGLLELAQSCGWIIPCDKVCFASERHSLLKKDSKGVPHCENGPAISYPDGWSIYADHGTVVPEKVVTDPYGLTFKELKKLPPVVNEIVLKKIGIEKFLAAEGTEPEFWNKLFEKITAETMND
jgi:hypothetical protein